MSSEKLSKKIETKDWVYLFIISLFLQFIIYYFSFIYGGSVKALGYVSFAGTLISILLAIIAIGYTYGESIKQKTSSDQLLVEIAGLRDIKDKLAGQVDILENISAIKSVVEDTKNAVNRFDVSKELEKFQLQLKNTENSTLPANIELDKIEQIIMGFKGVCDSHIFEIMDVIENSGVEKIEEIVFHLVEKDVGSKEWLILANLYIAIYHMCESVGIFKGMYIQDGIKDIYIKKYPRDFKNVVESSHFGMLIKKILY
jgi:uncharacterized membrane protein YccF (DUF307 family)